MKKYVIFIFVLFFSFQAYSQSLDSIDNIQGITPKEYFSSGRISYYFGYDGIISIKMDNTSSLVIDKLPAFCGQEITHDMRFYGYNLFKCLQEAATNNLARGPHKDNIVQFRKIVDKIE